jgi:hypothetical protein
VECAFGLLKKRFNILVILDRSYSQRTLGLIMRACIILHNMISDDERDDSFDENYHTVTSIVTPPVNYEAPASLTSIFQREMELTTGLMFLHLQPDLMEHVWNKFTRLMYLLFLYYIIFLLSLLCNFYLQVLCKF